MCTLCLDLVTHPKTTCASSSLLPYQPVDAHTVLVVVPSITPSRHQTSYIDMQWADWSESSAHPTAAISDGQDLHSSLYQGMNGVRGVHVAVKHFDLNKNYDTTVPFSIHQQVPPTLQCLILSVLRISSHYKVCRNASSEQYRKQMYLHILLPPAHLLPLLHL